jgi:hypothetical protein
VDTIFKTLRMKATTVSVRLRIFFVHVNKYQQMLNAVLFLATTLRGQCGCPSQVAGSSLSRTLGAAHAKTEAHVAYELRFRRSIYGWKDNFIIWPMTLVPHQNSSRIN